MENEEDKSEQRKEKIKNWLKNPQNLLLVGIIIFAFVIRLYYFILTKNQPLWWDEACYGSLAKNFLFGGRWDGTGLIQKEIFIRPLLFPILWTILLKIGLQEVGVRFILEFLPSIISVFFVYLTAKELYNKNIALISTFIFSTIWVHLFYTARLLTDIPILAFLFPSIYYFIKSQKAEFNAKYFGISIFLLSLSTLLKYTTGIIFFVYLAFLLLTWRVDLLKNKKFWIAGILGMIPLAIFFFFNYSNYGNIFPQLLSGEYYGKDTGQPKPPIAFNTLNLIPVYLKTVFFVLFVIGAAILLFELIVSYDLITKKQKIKSHLFVLLLFTIFCSFFIFSVGGAEDRYLLPISITFVLISGIGINSIYNSVKKYNKQIIIILFIVIMIFGAYQEITFADAIIKNKKESFWYERIGFEWVASNTAEKSVMIGRGTGPYSLYYAKRDYLEPPAEENISQLDNTKASYFIFNIYRPEREDVINYIQQNPDKWVPIHAFFLDEQKQQPAFVVYKKINSSLQ